MAEKLNSDQTPLPHEFKTRILKDHLEGERLLRALDGTPDYSILLHPEKDCSLAPEGTPVPWNAQGRYLDERPQYTLIPGLHGGAFYPQEASSMFLAHVLNSIDIGDGPICLDACAAPGGKSLVIQNHLRGKGLLVSNEVILRRNIILRENLAKWGYVNRVVTQCPTERFPELAHAFDLVLVDAPCSGEGMFRKDFNARSEWSADHVIMCASRQATILDDLAESVRKGGYLVYSTCTFSVEENEKQVKYFCAAHGYEPIDIPVQEDWGVEASGTGMYHFWPHKTRGEGLFMSVLQKTGGHNRNAFIPFRRNFKRIEAPFDLPEGLVAIEGKIPFLFPEKFLDVLEHIRNHLYIQTAGIHLGEMKGADFVPDHELALSVGIDLPYPDHELTKEEALSYLRKDNLRLDLPPGWYRVTHGNVGLGWVKVIANRVNNYYPKNWRIRMR